MAEEDDLDLNIAEEGGSKKKLIIIIAIAAVLLIGGAVAAWLLLSGDDEVADPEQAGEQSQQEETVQAEKGDMTYHDLAPVFVANLVGKPRMLQVGLQVRIAYPELAGFLVHNAPALRHVILNLLSAQDGQVLQTREAKEKLRGEIKDEINKLIVKYKGPGEVEEVLFSSFVMQ